MNGDPRRRRHPALVRNRHVNRLGLPIEKPVQLGRSLVTESSSRTDGEDRGPQVFPATQFTGERGVDTRVDPPPPTATDPELHHVLGDPGLERLDARDNARLPSD